MVSGVGDCLGACDVAARREYGHGAADESWLGVMRTGGGGLAVYDAQGSVSARGTVF